MHLRTGRAWTVVRVIVALILFMPLAWAFWASLQPIDEIFTAPAEPIRSDADTLQWQNYATAVTRLPFLRFLLNSCLITTLATIGTVFSSSLVGFAFARLQWRGKSVCFAILLATMMLPDQVMLIPQFLIFEHLGWVNTYKPLIVPSWLGGSAFFIFLFRQFFRSVPRSYEDAARIDGATHWQVYRHVMLPISRPVIGAVAALSAVHHWQAFLDPLVYLSDFHAYPVSVGLRMYQSMEGSWANLIMAASLIALVPPLIVVLLTQRYLMRNIGVRREGL
ncbi:MAG: carbohydrate ABC transporter permease [Phycisphaerales bacterium]|nr:carbohydrate ABC transporter permease [Phycisphaerales bacterium]